MKILILFLCFVPNLYEAFTDRAGEKRKDKFWDGVILVGYSILLVGGAWWAGYAPLPVAGLILMFRVTTFDYIVNAFLKRYSKGHKNINIWTYSGTTAFTDRIVSKVHPVLRLALRASLFAVALWWYLKISIIHLETG